MSCRRILDFELILADIASIEKRMERLEKDLKKQKTPALLKEQAFLERAKPWLESEKPLRDFAMDDEEKKLVKGFAFLSEKPMLYVENIGEDQLDRLKQAGASSYPRLGGRSPVTASAGRAREAEARHGREQATPGTQAQKRHRRLRRLACRRPVRVSRPACRRSTARGSA